jgi:hypothetical protein
VSAFIKEAVCKEIIKSRFLAGAAKAISLVSGCLNCYNFKRSKCFREPHEINSGDVIEIFSNYATLPSEDFKDIVGIGGCPGRQDEFYGLSTKVDNYCSLIVYLKYLYLKLLEGIDVVCMGYETDDTCLSNSFLFIEDGVLYSISFEIVENEWDCNFVSTTIAAFNAEHSEAAGEYYGELERCQTIAESFYIENYMDL